MNLWLAVKPSVFAPRQKKRRPGPRRQHPGLGTSKADAAMPFHSNRRAARRDFRVRVTKRRLGTVVKPPAAVRARRGVSLVAAAGGRFNGVRPLIFASGSRNEGLTPVRQLSKRRPDPSSRPRSEALPAVVLLLVAFNQRPSSRLQPTQPAGCSAWVLEISRAGCAAEAQALGGSETAT